MGVRQSGGPWTPWVGNFTLFTRVGEGVPRLGPPLHYIKRKKRWDMEEVGEGSRPSGI